MIALALALLSLEAPFVPGPRIDFQHRSGGAEKTYIVETMGSGVALLDYDGDSDQDLFLVNAGSFLPFEGAPDRLFRNDGALGFEDVTERAGLGDRDYGQGAAVGDVDNDGDPDLYVTNYGPNALYRNQGDGTFVRVAAGVEDPRWSASAALADVDGDGFLDLYVCNYLDFDRELLDRLIPQRFCEWKGLRVNCGPRGFPHVSGALFRNRGDFTFEDRTRDSGVEADGAYQLGAVFSDLDRDGDPDLYVATDSTPNLLFVNSGDGTFEDRSLASGAAFSHAGTAQAGMGVDAGDVNGDGMMDLVVTNFSDDYNSLYLNQGGLLFLDATDLLGLAVASLPYLGWGVFLEDFDADRDLDLFLVNGHVYPQVDGSGSGESFRQPMQLFWNEGGNAFREQVAPFVDVPRASRGAAVGDLDGDGAPDVVVSVMDSEPVLLQNRAGSGFVRLELVGRGTNREGIGAKIQAGPAVRELRRARGYLSSSEAAVWFPAGSEVFVEWPGGAKDELGTLGAGRYVVVEGVGIVHRTE